MGLVKIMSTLMTIILVIKVNIENHDFAIQNVQLNLLPNYRNNGKKIKMHSMHTVSKSVTKIFCETYKTCVIQSVRCCMSFVNKLSCSLAETSEQQ